MRQPVPFGKYLLLDRISVGGMAEVFKAKSYGVEGFEKIIAIKRILPTMGEDRDFIKMFIDEAKIAGQLAHANICQIFELGRIDGSHFIAMEYIWGKDLLQIQNRLRKIKQPMPAAMACFIIAKVLEGLDYAHRKRDPLGRPLEIVHRDCSPQNVLVSYEGEVKVIDFGIAKATSRNSRTMAGVLKGKFGYMSPEQVRGLPLDRRSDIFALGTMLYECLTSDRLFQGETDFSTLEKVRNVDIRLPRELNPNIPESVEKVILKALAKDVDDRYQWCSEMLADIQAFLMSQDVVFTAKSLSGWLKEVFSSEIERERQQLEQYKRVGRDGLIQDSQGRAVPAAAAKLDVVDALGEAPAVEGDATQLGGPSFDELEQMVAAAATPGMAAASSASQAQDDDDDDDGEFGEEAPTEIFGDLEQPRQPSSPMAAVAARRPSSPPVRNTPAPMRNTPGPVSRPPPTPARAPTASHPPAYAARPTHNANAATIMNDGNAASAQLDDARAAYAQNFGGSQNYPAQNMYSQNTPAPQMAHGTPGGMAVGAPQNQSKTLLGAGAPVGLPNYAQQGYSPSGQQPAAYPPQYASNPNVNPYANPSNPSMPHMLGQQPSIGSMQQSPYGSQQGYASQQPMPAIDSTIGVVEGPRKSSIGRDVAIGVAIAALVLGGFLAVKFFVLDASDEATTTASSEIATLRISMPEGVVAELYVDDEKKVQAVHNKLEVPIGAGQRKIKLVGPNGSRCESEMKLPAGKVTTVECIMHAGQGSAGSAGAAPPPTGSAGVGSAGSATQVASAEGDKKTVVDSAEKAAAETAAAEKEKKDKEAADKKAAAEKAAADKAAAEKAAADKKPAQPTTRPQPKEKKDKMPVEENPIDAAANAPAKGFLKIVPPPSAQILIDGGAPPGSLSKIPLAVGKHKVQFVMGNDKHTFSVTIKAGETVTLDKKDLQ